jgi:endonuclease/exonuclease/phosphatase (EEP) superfamily protein YafD
VLGHEPHPFPRETFKGPDLGGVKPLTPPTATAHKVVTADVRAIRASAGMTVNNIVRLTGGGGHRVRPLRSTTECVLSAASVFGGIVNVLAGWLCAALLAAASAPVAVAVSASAAPGNLQVMSWNMCGSQRSTWHCENTGPPEQKIGVVTYHVQNNYVQVVLLQEICEDDLALLMTRLGTDWSRAFVAYQWSQAGVTSDSRCGNDDGRAARIGTAIVVKAGMSGARRYPTTQPWTGQHRPFHCATATYWGVRLCNAHLSPRGANPEHPDREYADDQLAEIRDVVATFPTVVLGGDFNVQPPDAPANPRAWLWPDGLYATGEGSAGYRECDQEGTSRTGRPTHDEGWKIDYIFSTESRRWCAVGNSAYSDHHVVIYSVLIG